MVVLLACGPKPTEETDATLELAPASWLAELPQRTVAARPGEKVWAVVPELGSERATIATYDVESANGTTATLLDAIGSRFEGIPGALVHPVTEYRTAELAAGMVVLADRWGANLVVGRLARLADGAAFVQHDWNGHTVVDEMAVAVPLLGAGEDLALRWVSYQREPAGPRLKGLCFAAGDDRVWIAEDNGFVAVLGRHEVEVLDSLGGRDFQPGDTVAAYLWGFGYRPGEVSTVLEPQLRYAVRLEGEQAAQPFFFTDLIASP